MSRRKRQFSVDNIDVHGVKENLKKKKKKVWKIHKLITSKGNELQPNETWPQHQKVKW